ncbi:hypothetical protein ACH4NF_34930 [Streptomyces sp. NPDC017248]|uniref:hypothetical protein n=1 Tax=unclassified Streptomyces TaxID=2593676 RepID=UPI00379C5519
MTHFEYFTAWHLRCVEVLDAARATDMGDDEYRSWAYTVFSRNGELPPAAFGALLHARRVRLTERALDLLAEHDARDAGPVEIPRPWVEDPGEAFPLGMATVGGELVDSFTWQGIVICVARGVQAYVAEAREELWPVCPDHGRGLHAAPAQGRAAWWCLATDHVVAWILDPDPFPGASASRRLV